MSESGQLLWRCRRGTKELDVLLERYVRRDYSHASVTEQSDFERLLELPDPLLIDYFFGNAAPDQPSLAQLVARIVTHRD